MRKILLSLVLLFVGLLPLIQAQVKLDPKPTVAKKHYTGRKVDKRKLARDRAIDKTNHAHIKLPRATAPAYDCRTLGYVPPIKDQGQCGSCWDFSGTAVVECALIKAGILKNDGSTALSEQYTLDCGNNGGCGGDDNTTVTAWAKATGIPLTSDYGPYKATSGSCKTTKNLYKIADWGFAGEQNGVTATQDIKNAMVAYGPIGCAIDAGVLGDGTGIISGSGHSIDHDVVLVGWDDSKGKSGCWIMRNSWGMDWGVDGYCTIEYGSGDVGTEAIWATAAALPPPPPPAPPTPPPGPTPPPAPPTPGTVTITLTPEQVASVVAQHGGVVITGDMSLREILDALDKVRKTKDGKPCCGAEDKTAVMEADIRDLKRGMEAILKMLLPAEKKAPEPSGGKTSKHQPAHDDRWNFALVS